MLRIEDLAIDYNGERIIDNFSIQLERGGKGVISGPSGSGKSSLLRVIAGLQRPSRGTVYLDSEALDGGNLNRLRRSITYIPQELSATGSVLEFIIRPWSFRANQHLNNQPGDITSLLKELLLDEKILSKNMEELSGGEKQRIIIITAILLKRPLLAIDEGVSALDSKAADRVIDLIFNQPDLTVISAAHNLEWASRCDKVFKLKP